MFGLSLFGPVKLKDGGKMTEICYRDTHSFIVHVKSEDIYADLVVDVKK